MSKALKNKVKLNNVVDVVADYGADPTGVADSTTALNNAFAGGGNVVVPPGTYLVSKGAGAYVLTVPANIKIVGTQGVTTIKLSSAAADCHIIGTASTSTTFWMEGITIDGNKSVVSGVNVNGVYLPQATDVVSRRNTYQNLKDLGSSVGGHGIYISNSTQVNRVVVEQDTFTNIDTNPVQGYYCTEVTVRDCYASGILKSFTDLNGQTTGTNSRTKTQITNNVIVCDASFSTSLSVLSLLGNDVECTGNKIAGGGIQIVVHDLSSTSYTLRNYNVSNNDLWQAKSDAIDVYQNSTIYGNNYNQSVIVSNNNIYQPTGSGIAVIGAYAGSGTIYGSTVIANNIITDGLTSSPAPEQYAGIRLQGATNVSVNGNVITAPRWAGIQAHFDGRNISIANNVITDHQGRTTTGSGGATPQAGGPIFIGGNGTAYLGNIDIVGNVIQNYATQVSPQAFYARTGGIVVNGALAQDISIKNNRVMTGNTAGIALLSCVNVTAESNEVTGFYSGPLNDASGIGTGCQLTYAISGPRSGATASRPTLTANQIGYNYWDTTLPKPIWWNGTVWKDQANTTV